jgi:hypothetical protein
MSGVQAPPVDPLLQKASKNSLQELVHQSAIDMSLVDKAMWQRRGGVVGWVDELSDIYEQEKRAGKHKTCIDILKLHLEVKKEASKAGVRAADSWSDEELEEVIKAQVMELADQNPDIISQILVAQAKAVESPTVPVLDASFLQ